MPTVQGAGSVNPTLTAGTDYAVASQAAALIASAANVQVATMSSGTTVPAVSPGSTGELVVASESGTYNQAGASILATAYQYFIVGDTLKPVAVTAGGAANLGVILGSGPIAFYSGGGSGTIAGGDGNKTINIGNGANFGIYTGAGNDTINMVGSVAAGLSTVAAGAGNNIIELGAQPTHITSTGSDTIAVSVGATTVQALGNSKVTLTGGSGNETLINGAGSASVTGSTGTATVLAGSGGATVSGGTSGNNLLIGGVGQTYLHGEGNGDLLIATSTQVMQVLEAGSGNETLLGSLSTMNNIFQASTGSDLILAGSGSDTIVAGSGSATVSGGAGNNDFLFNTAIARGGQVTIADFTPGTDRVSLIGYGDQPANLAAAAQFIGTGSRVTLSDGSTITFVGLGSVAANFFG